MVNAKANKIDRGVSVDIEIDATGEDAGIEILMIIAALMHDCKEFSPEIHHAVLGTIAHEPDILLGDVSGENRKGNMN